jgi:glycosyltransferase involved in cell wall biosynthesis
VAAYQAADVFMLPSLHEPFGIVVLEAWSAGLPVIAADTGGLKTLVDSGRTGLLFDSKSVDAALNAYFKLMGDSELRGRMRENAACEVREKYSWNTITEKLINFYCKVIYEHDKK